MKRQRLYLLGLMLALLLLVGACGGDDDEAGTGATTAERRQRRASPATISVIGVWTGPEQESFQAVIDGFTEENPDVTVKYTSGGDNIVTVLSTAVEGGNPPDIATVSQPGTMADFVERGALKPLDFAADAVARELRRVDRRDGQRRRHALRPPLQGGQQVDHLVQRRRPSRTPASRPPATWDDLLAAAKTINASGLPAYSIGGADGWTLTDLFENIYLRTAGAEKYDQLAKHEIPWTDQSVKDALDRDGEDRRRHGQHRRRHRRARCRPTSRPRSSNVFSATPEGRDGARGRLRPRRRRRRQPARARDRVQRVPVPVDRRLRRRPSSAAATSSSCSRTTRRRRRSSST